jgi:hypothetical protein
MVENDWGWFDAESMKQYLGLCGRLKPHFSTIDRLQ